MSSLKQNSTVPWKLETEISTHSISAPRGYFSKPEIFEHIPTIHYSSLKFDAVDEFSARNDTLQIDYQSSAYLFC